MRTLLVLVLVTGCSGSGESRTGPDASVDAGSLDAAPTVLTATCPNQGVGDGWSTGLGTCPTFDGYICADTVQQNGVRPFCCDDSGKEHFCSQTPTNWHLPYYDAGM